MDQLHLLERPKIWLQLLYNMKDLDLIEFLRYGSFTFDDVGDNVFTVTN